MFVYVLFIWSYFIHMHTLHLCLQAYLFYMLHTYYIYVNIVCCVSGCSVVACALQHWLEQARHVSTSTQAHVLHFLGSCLVSNTSLAAMVCRLFTEAAASGDPSSQVPTVELLLAWVPQEAQVGALCSE